jgi:hypothetical protein
MHRLIYQKCLMIKIYLINGEIIQLIRMKRKYLMIGLQDFKKSIELLAMLKIFKNLLIDLCSTLFTNFNFII